MNNCLVGKQLPYMRLSVKNVMHFGVGSGSVFLKLLLFVSMMQSQYPKFYIHPRYTIHHLSTIRQTFLEFLYKSSLTSTYEEYSLTGMAPVNFLSLVHRCHVFYASVVNMISLHASSS